MCGLIIPAEVFCKKTKNKKNTEIFAELLETNILAINYAQPDHSGYHSCKTWAEEIFVTNKCWEIYNMHTDIIKVKLHNCHSDQALRK